MTESEAIYAIDTEKYISTCQKTELQFAYSQQNTAIDMRPFTQRNIFEILLNQPEIRLYLQFSD